MPLKGDAGFKYDSGSGTVTVTLNYPLRRVTPSARGARWTRWSLDNKNSETTTIASSAVREITAVIRFEDDPVALLTMLEAGADGFTLTYYPSLAVTGTNYPAQLIEPSGGAMELAWDRARGSRQEYEVAIRLRRVDGGTFDALIQ